MSGADDYNLSQIISYDDVDIWSPEPLVQIALHRSALRTAEAILVPKIEHLTASILKNPFTMSNTGRLDPITVLSHGEPFLFIPGKYGERLDRSHPRRGKAAPSNMAEAMPAALDSALPNLRGGGAYRDRTDDLMLAKQPLSQLS